MRKGNGRKWPPLRVVFSPEAHRADMGWSIGFSATTNDDHSSWLAAATKRNALKLPYDYGQQVAVPLLEPSFTLQQAVLETALVQCQPGRQGIAGRLTSTRPSNRSRKRKNSQKASGKGRYSNLWKGQGGSTASSGCNKIPTSVIGSENPTHLQVSWQKVSSAKPIVALTSNKGI